MSVEQTADRRSSRGGRILLLAILAGLIGVILVGLTNGLSSNVFPPELEPHRGPLTSVEIALFGVIFLELLAKAALQYYEQQNARQLGIIVRAVGRTIGYMVIAVAVLSILSANPALAVGVGSMMGLVVGFSTQNVIANVFAGMFLAIGRPFRIDDEITVSSNTGRVIELTVMHTMIEAEGNTVLVPNASMLTQVILRKNT